MADLPLLQDANIACLPENYQLRYFKFHLVTWSALSWIAVDANGVCVGYILGKMGESKEEEPSGHVTSIAVKGTHRGLGIASQLVLQSMRCMREVYRATAVSLHVRETNKAAIALYKKIGFKKVKTAIQYYADSENGVYMKCNLDESAWRTTFAAVRDHLVLDEDDVFTFEGLTKEDVERLEDADAD